MDGLAEDADVVFVLTTNRADLLEPALASRPGRVDQAVELTLPDLTARRALFELYRGRLRIEGDGVDDVLVRCEGVDGVVRQGAAPARRHRRGRPTAARPSDPGEADRSGAAHRPSQAAT